MKSRNFLKPFLASTLLSSLVLQAGVSYADDTEIFFGGPTIDNNTRPNVLFILDNSGSMNWRLDSNNTASGGQKSRLMVLKESFADILNNTSNINIGVMVLNGRSEYDNSRFMYPVTYIDGTLGGSSNLAANTPGILQSADDATQAISPAGSAVIDNPTLLMGTTSSTGNQSGQTTSELGTTGSFILKTVTTGNGWNKITTEYACRMTPPSGTRKNCSNNAQSDIDLKDKTNQEALFQFKNLSLPAGATITDAYIEITPTNTPSKSSRKNPYLDVRMENSKNPTALNDDNPVGNRTYQDTAVVQVNGWEAGNRVAIDVTNQIKTLTSAAPAQDPITGVFVRLFGNAQNTDNQSYTFCANACSQGKVPILIIKYSAPSGLTSEKRMGALRFQEVGIPQGATVTNARISFIPAASNSDPATFQVRAEKVGDASSFAAGSDLTARSKTAALTTWEAEAWEQTATPEPVPGPDVTQLVQEVVNLPGWCGNNAMAFYLTPTSGNGLRSAHSFDGAGGLQPVLTVSYTGGETGCLQEIVEVRVSEQKNDAYQNNSGTVTLGGTVLPLSLNRIGARFGNLPIGRGATVVDAKLTMTPANTVASPNQTSKISFQNSASSSIFTSSSNNLSSNRTLTSEVNCPINSTIGWESGVPVTCDISALNDALTGIFASSSWNKGNALNLFARQTSDSGLNVTAYESNPAQSLKLRLKVRNAGSSTSVRSQVNALVQSMYAQDGTPIVPTLYDAVKYFRGDISGRTSPINSACQANHLVLLTDGQANSNTSTAKSGIASLTNTTCSNDASDDGEKCGRTLSKWIAENDQSSRIEGDNLVTTHTVGFALDASGATESNQIKTFLRELAENGGGSFNTAESAAELSTAFNRIIQEVLATNTTFVNASAPINSFNRQDNKDQLYFSLFRPSDKDRWYGNLKRYRMKVEDGVATIVDADGIAAIDSNTGFFRTDARSFWTQTRDGSDITLGGAAHQLPTPVNRKLFTYYGASPAGTAVSLSGYPITVDNTGITAERLDVSDSERAALIDYIRGLDSEGNARNGLGDPIHSSPRLVTYACESFVDGECVDEDQSAIIGSNEGFIHLFDTDTGKEQFAFMPEVLLPNIKRLKANAKSTSQKPRLYGMDNTVALWVNDANNNGVIYGGKDPVTGNTLSGKNSGEFVYAYATMGRGGRNIYALDITDRSSPKLLWQILGGTTSGFEKLGQTWSVPVKTRIKVGSNIKDVLIFGGGYDVNQDELNQSDSARSPDSLGNALYIVDAKTGAKIWSAGNDESHNLNLAKMQYSIPGKVRVIDIQSQDSSKINENGQLLSDGVLVHDADKLADQIFVGDMGGQVWRFFINNGNSGSNLITAGGSNGDGVFANVAGNTPGSARRFYYEPDVALLKVNNSPVLTINIGSGYRGHPLNKTIEDRFYSFRTDKLFTNGNEGTLTEGELYDATQNLVQIGNDAQKTAAKEAFSAPHGGWYITLQGDGEKVLSRALAAGDALYFNTYEPSTNNVACSASVGKNRAYSVRLLNATPISVAMAGNGTYEDRYQNSNSGGISSDPQLFCQGNDCYVLPDPSVPPTPIKMPPLGKTYWIDK